MCRGEAEFQRISQERVVRSRAAGHLFTQISDERSRAAVGRQSEGAGKCAGRLLCVLTWPTHADLGTGPAT